MPMLISLAGLAGLIPEGFILPEPRVCTTTAAPRSSGTRRDRGRYIWPTLHGQPDVVAQGLGHDFTAPRKVTEDALAWSWHHPQGRFYTFLSGVLIDDQSNFYLSATDAIRKLSPDGEVIWTYCAPNGYNVFESVPTLMDGVLFADTRSGEAFALDMETGEELWKTKVGNAIGADTHATMASEGVVILGTDGCQTPVCQRFGSSGSANLHGLDASNGRKLWTFRPDTAVWNFYAIFPGDGTFLFQDLEGKMYRNHLRNGSLIWKRGGIPGSWNDGSAGAGPDGIVYAVETRGPNNQTDGFVKAYRTEDGELLWTVRTVAAPNQYPALGLSGKRGAGSSRSLVVSMGGPIFDVISLDPHTGAQQWQWSGMPYPPEGPRGDREGLPIRRWVQPGRPVYDPNIWGNPVVDANGTAFIGFLNGGFFAVQDANGDGRIDWDTEVSGFDAKAAFVGGSPALAPGLVAVTSLDTLFVFKTIP